MFLFNFAPILLDLASISQIFIQNLPTLRGKINFFIVFMYLFLSLIISYRPLIHGLTPFLIWSRIRRAIRFESSKICFLFVNDTTEI
jgi:hypothetical protein